MVNGTTKKYISTFSVFGDVVLNMHASNDLVYLGSKIFLLFWISFQNILLSYQRHIKIYITNRFY